MFEESVLTIRELRKILFDIEDQKMTIEELRRNLFDIEDQDKFHKISKLKIYTNK